MNVLRKIIDQWGFLRGEEDIKELAKEFPCFKVCIKWGMMQRELIQAEDVLQRIENVMNDPVYYDNDYVREVFVTADDMTTLKSVVGDYEPFTLNK
jgi:hypothetical protein